jgi:putative toxin-antitoxin system antitoxin component (TIGR02293 family)
MHLPQTEIEIARELAADVFGDEDLGKNWLLEPNMATDDKPPLSLLGTSGGLERVKNLLLRLQYGVLA